MSCFFSCLCCLFPPDLMHELSLQTRSGCVIDHVRPDGGGYYYVCMLSAVFCLGASVSVHCALLPLLPFCCWPRSRVQQRAAALRQDSHGTAHLCGKSETEKRRRNKLERYRGWDRYYHGSTVTSRSACPVKVEHPSHDIMHSRKRCPLTSVRSQRMHTETT